MRHLLDTRTLAKDDAMLILDTAEDMAATQQREVKKLPTLRGKTVVNLFYEDSTRTRISFEAAAKRLSADVIKALGYDPRDRLEVGPSETVLATGDVFVSDPAVRDRLAERAHLVDMEGYAVAWAALAAGSRVRLVKHVSDAADEGAMDWPSLVEASAVELGKWLRSSL